MSAILPRCEVCLQFLEFHTDWIGQVVWKHPSYRCVAPQALPTVPDEDKTFERICDECKRAFAPRKLAANARLCGPACRKARRERLWRETEANRGKEWKLQVLESLDLPIKTCPECGKTFTQSSRFAGKQFLCSRACRKVREARKDKERAA